MLVSCLKRQTSESSYCHKSKEIERSTERRTSRSVTFADLLGKRLEFVKTITPNSSSEDLTSLHGNVHHYNHYDLNNSENALKDQGFIFKTKNQQTKELSGQIKFLSCCLPQPLFKRDFEQRFEKNKVCLENIFVCSRTTNVLIGVIRVKNIAYAKDVFIRYTLNRWKDYQEKKAEFTFQCTDGSADKFIFRLAIHPKLLDELVGGEVEFVIGFEVNSITYWDNNNGSNYKAHYFTKI